MESSEDDFIDDCEEKDYGLNLQRFANHKRVFPWRFIIKVIIGITLVVLVYYLTNQVVERQKVNGRPEPEDGIEVTISEH